MDDLREWFIKFQRLSYNLSESAFEANKIDDPFMVAFIDHLRDLFKKYEDKLTRNNFEDLVFEVVKVNITWLNVSHQYYFTTDVCNRSSHVRAMLHSLLTN